MCIRRVQKRGDLDAQLNAQQEEHDIAKGAIDAALSRLGLWNGTPEDLVKLPVPSQETIDEFRESISQQRNRLEELKGRRGNLEEELHSARVSIEALKREQDVPTEETLHAARNTRKSSWKLVRKSWEEGTRPCNVEPDATHKALLDQDIPDETIKNLADVYEIVTDQADDVSDRLRREADRTAKLAQLEARASDVAQKLGEAISESERVGKEHTTLEKAWNKLWAPLGIEPRSPREMSKWAKNQEGLVSQIGALQAQTVRIASLRKAIKESREELKDALCAIGEAESCKVETLAALLDGASQVVASKRKALQNREQLETELASLEQDELPAAQYAMEESSSELHEWQAAWHKAMEELGETVDTPPKKANGIIQQIDELLSAFDKVRDLQRRIDEIARDDQDFRDEVFKLVHNVAPNLADLSADQAILAAHSELQQSKNDHALLTDLGSQRDAEEEHRQEATAVLSRIDAEFSDLCKEAQVESVDALPEAEEHSQVRRKQEAALKDVDDRLVELASGAKLEDFLTEVGDEDPDALEPEIAQLNTDISERENDLKRISEEIGEQRKALQLMDGSAEAAEVADEAQALLASMAADVEEYSRLRICELLLARAIEQYREKHQGPLLRRAGELFSALTLGSFRDLTPDFDENGADILVGLRADNNTAVPVSGMSDGTADQLYLALRLASLEQYLRKHQPIPFILDDILINFDNDRAIAVLKILADLSRQTQIISFTHHHHLVELAEKNIEPTLLFTHTLS